MVEHRKIETSLFTNHLKKLKKRYSRSCADIDNVIEDICSNPEKGIRMPNSVYLLYKRKFGLIKYLLRESAGCRFVYIFEANVVCFVAAYSHKDYSDSQAENNIIKDGLKQVKALLDELVKEKSEKANE